MTTKILKASCLLDGTRREPVADGAVVVHNGQILYAGPAGSMPDVAGEVVELPGTTLLPGLIDAHVHLTMDGSADIVQRVTTDTLPMATVRAVVNAERLIRAGITTVRDCGCQGNINIDLARMVSQGIIRMAPHILAAGPAICMTGGHGHFIGWEVDGPDEVRKAVRKVIKAGADVIKLIATGGVITPGVTAGAPQFSLEELRVAVEEARKAGLTVAAHAHGAEGIKNALRAGVTTVEHASYVDDEGIQLFLETGAIFVSTLLASRRQVEHLHEVPDYVAYKISRHIDIESHSVRRLIAAGVPAAGGTDAGTPFNPHGDLAEQLIMLAEHGLGTMGAIEAGTRISARALGIEHLTGTLEAGKRADILAVQGNPAENLEHLKQVVAVWKSGERLV
ncbi:MAG: amidohydrolase family protein [Limnochordaceae bacterium]|nr:amidohydrolase family protein [Limnochordaceae bacterium]